MAQAIRVMHFADTHFGVELYGRLDPETGLNSRLIDFKESLLRAVDSALDQGVHLAVFAGDAYKTRDPHQTDQREFASCIRRLTDRGVPVILLVGNHDLPAIKGRANAVEIYKTLGVTNVHVMSKPDLLIIDTSAGPVRIAAMPYLVKGFSVAKEEFQGKSLEETRDLLEKRYIDHIENLAFRVTEAADDIPTILLGHFWASNARLSSWQQSYFANGEPQVNLSTLANPAFDYVGLGHIHRHQDLQPDVQPHVVYSGSPDRIDFGERDEAKGYVLVDLRKGGADYQFVNLEGGRPLIDIRVNADTDDPTRTIIEEVRRHSLRDAIVKLTYEISHEHQALVREREVREALSLAFMVVAVNRKVNRSQDARNRLLTESRTPREALALYIDTREKLQSRKELLMRYAEPLFVETEQE